MCYFLNMKHTTAFLNYLRLYIGNNPDFDAIASNIIRKFTVLELNKNDYFVKEAAVCNHFCFVESGILQHAIMVQDEEKTTYLALQNSVTSSLQSFLHQVPSRKSIKALTASKLWVIDLHTFKELSQTIPAFHQFYHSLIEKQICLIDDYRIDLLTLTPEERYQKLHQNEPKLLQEIPLHYLASFLGISTRNMSRIRKNVK